MLSTDLIDKYVHLSRNFVDLVLCEFERDKKEIVRMSKGRVRHVY